MSTQARRPVPDGPYETEEQARTDVAKIMARREIPHTAMPWLRAIKSIWLTPASVPR